MARGLTEDERSLLTHWSRFGSDGYPIRKLGRGWTWDYRSIKGPEIYKTKKAATAAFERFIDVLIEASGEEAYERAVAEATVSNLEFALRNEEKSL